MKTLLQKSPNKHLAKPQQKKSGSFLELASDLCGCGLGPIDLSTNSKYMGYKHGRQTIPLIIPK